MKKEKIMQQTNATSTQMTTNRFPYPIQDLGPMSGTPEEIYKRAETIVQVFERLCQLENLELRSDEFGYTDCQTFVAANFSDPEAYLTVEHELSHIFFDSDLALGEQFRLLIIEELFKKAGFKVTSKEMAPYKQALEQFIHHTWNCLEDHRVRSLWEEIFPGGGYFLEKRWENIAEHCLEEQAEKTLLGYIARSAAVCHDTQNAPEQFKQCFAAIMSARSVVDKTDNKTCLAITKQLFESVIDTLHIWAKTNGVPANPNAAGVTYKEDLLLHAKRIGMVSITATDLSSAQPSRVEALSKIVQLTGAIEDSSEGQSQQPNGVSAGGPNHNPMGGKDIKAKPGKNQNRNTRVNATDVRRIKQLSKMASRAQSGDAKAKAELEKLIEKGTEEMKRKIQLAKSELGKGGKQEDPAEADKIEYLSAAKAAGIHTVVIDKPLELPKPSVGASKVQSELERIKMQQKTRLYEEGDEIDVEAYIDAKVNHQIAEARLFKATTKESGLELLVLTDCSGSMYGNGIAMVDQAMADIEHAVKNLKVKTHLWGFSNSLYVFTKKGSMQNIGGGGTDLIPALDTALEWARQSKSSRGIIMLTDGYPTSCRNRNSTGEPRKDMYNVLTEAQNEGIVISILCINEHVSEYVRCSCDNGGDWAYPNKAGTCSSCGSAVLWSNRQKEEYDKWFGKGNWAQVSSKKDIAKELPKAARALVLNHINRHR